MKRSIFLKIFAGYLVITILLTLFILLFSFRTIRDYHTNTLSRHLLHLATTLSLQVKPMLKENGMAELDALAKDLGRRIETRITIINPEGVVLADSDEDPGLMENHRSRPEIIQAMNRKTGRSVRFSRTVNEEMLYIAIPVEGEGAFLGVLRVSVYLRDINQFLRDLRTSLAYIAMVPLAFSLLTAFLLSRSFSKRIRALGAASQRVARGDFEARGFLKGEDELRELGDSFNQMTSELNDAFRELSQQKEELSSIVSHLQEGLIVLDKKGKILLSNASFDQIAQSTPSQGKFYWEVVREPGFSALIRRTAREQRNFAEEVELDSRIFLCTATFLEPREEIVVTFHDITQMKRLEKMKKDFVLNVSHELRTPLTAIKGFTETLEETDKNARYLEIVKRHTDRLINIVDDLLSLSELEERGVKLEVERVNLKAIVENILRIFEQRLKEKNLNLAVISDDHVSPIKADPYRLEQMFINLVDNAIKYTDKGEIRISLKQVGDEAAITVEDTGIGIPYEHLPRIFERFYVADRSRSKRLGGTGLGLSIVKHIVLLHRGSIDVESTPGTGTKFTIVLPVTPD